MIAGYPLVRRLGPRHDDRAARAVPRDRAGWTSPRTILDTFARFVDGGHAAQPVSRQPATRPEYNTVDATLWFVEAWRAYLEATGDDGGVARESFRPCRDRRLAHPKGTRYGIGVDPADGLLHAGEPGIQLTWMDAKVGDWVVTPRMGKPVEINALWYNALVAMAALAARIGEPGGTRIATRPTGAQPASPRFVQPDGAGACTM